MVRYLPKISQLKALKVVAYYGSINSAAKALGVPQPTLSRSIRELEELLSVGLVVRGRAGITLTDAGRRFANHASSIVEELQTATEEARSASRGTASTKMAFGLSPITVNSIFSAAITRLMAQYGECEFLVEDNPLEINVERLRRGLLDFAVGNARADVSFAEFSVEPLMDVPFAIVCAKGHPLAHATRLEELAHADWWVTGEFRVCQKEREDFRELAPKTALRSRSHIVGLPMLFHNGFLALLSSVQIKMYRPYLAVIPIKNLRVVGSYALLRRKNVPLSEAAERLITLLHQEAESFNWNDFGDEAL